MSKPIELYSSPSFPRPEDGELVLEVGDFRLEAVPLLQDVLQLGEGEPGTVGVVFRVHHLGKLRTKN